MSSSFSGATRRIAVVCVVVAASLANVFVSRAAAGTGPSSVHVTHTIGSSVTSLEQDVRGRHSSSPVMLHATGDVGGVPQDGHGLLAFPPVAKSGALTVVYLHGVHGRAANGCPWLRSGASEVGWLVCPEGAVHDDDGTSSWGGDVFKQSAVVSGALRAARQAGASDEPGVAVGFSQGSYVALDLVKTHLGHFRGLVLLAAPEAHPSAQKLRDAGVTRIALGAGSLDAAYAPLVEDAKRLASEGIEARFVDLGRVAHTYAAENTEALRALSEAIAWAGGQD